MATCKHNVLISRSFLQYISQISYVYLYVHINKLFSVYLKLADLLFLQESKSLDNNKLSNACICQEFTYLSAA